MTTGRTLRVKLPEELQEGFPVIEPGRYPVMVDLVEERTSKSGGPMLHWEFLITVGPYRGQRLFGNTPTSGEYMNFLAGYLSALGLPCEGPVDVDLDEIEGLVAVAEVTHGVYEGRRQHRLARLFPEDEDLRPSREKSPARAAVKQGGEAEELADGGGPIDDTDELPESLEERAASRAPARRPTSQERRPVPPPPPRRPLKDRLRDAGPRDLDNI